MPYHGPRRSKQAMKQPLQILLLCSRFAAVRYGPVVQLYGLLDAEI